MALSGCAGGPMLSSILPFFPIPTHQIATPEAPLEILDGTDRAIVARNLGQPELVRHEGAAEIWHYSGDQCRLLIFLYSEGDSANVRHVDVWPQNQDAKTCMASVSHRLASGPAAKGVTPVSYP